MKAFRLLATSLLVVSSMGFVSCGDDELKQTPLDPQVTDNITISNSPLNFNEDAGEAILSFSSNKEWTISVSSTANDENWCTVTPTKGEAGNNEVQIKVTENTGYDDRNVSLTIQAGNASETVVVTQKQKDALTLTSNKFEVSKAGGKINVEVKSKIQYEVIISETSKSWISQSAKTRGLNTNNISFDIAPSEEYDKRTGEIIIQSGELSETVHVYQSGEGVLLLTKNEYSVSDKGETIAVDLKSNFEFDVKMPNVDWVQSAAKTRGMSSHTLYYTIAPNETYDSRKTEIIFYDKNSSIKDTLKIEQAQKDAIIIGKKEYKISANGETVGIELNSNINYEILLPTGCSWIKIVDEPMTKGLEQHTIYFKIEKNDTPTQRDCEITISNKASNISETVKFIQESGGYVHILNKLYEITSETTSIHVDIDANVYYAPIVPAEFYWIKYTRSNGNRLYFDIEENYSNETRKGYIIIDSPEILQQDTVSIIQTSQSNWIKKTIHLDVAGTLENLINSEQLFLINELTLTGNLNDDDFTILRDMTGEQGQLSYLNLKDTNIEEIPSAAFDGVDRESKLIHIILPHKCKEIGLSSFQVNEHLESVEFPNVLERIREGAFSNTGLKEAILPSSVKTIETGAFFNCTSLHLAKLPNVSYIGETAFKWCEKLTNIELSPSLNYIGAFAFQGTGISMIDIPEGVEELYGTFYNCFALTKLTLPKSLKKVNANTFSFCYKLTDIYINAPIPPSCDGNFENLSVDECVLHVPQGSYTEYRHADGWNKFTNIVMEE